MDHDKYGDWRMVNRASTVYDDVYNDFSVTDLKAMKFYTNIIPRWQFICILCITRMEICRPG